MSSHKVFAGISMSLTLMVWILIIFASNQMVPASVTALLTTPPVCGATWGNSNTCCSTSTCRKVSCSPLVLPILGSSGVLTLQNFSAATTPSKCDGVLHNNTEKVVALSTGWYNGGSRCGHNITIIGFNGRITKATVVDECDSTQGCLPQNGTLGQPPCGNNIVNASPAVWVALGVAQNDFRYGYMRILWKDSL